MNANVYLKKHCKVSARMITRLKREKNGILRNDELLRTIDNVFSGDIVKLNLPEDKNEIVPIKGHLEVLYEDDYVIVVNKPYNMPVHPTKIHQEDTLANYLMYMQQRKGERYTFRAINRLDKDTSGLVVIAKDRYCANYLFKTMNKIYIAVCEGIVEGTGTINKPIGLLEGHTIQRAIMESGEPSITHYKSVEHINNHTLLEIILETGHTHQIRCHFSGIGYPLAGDDMYGGSVDLISRQALHCKTVSFLHPITHEQIEVTSEIPEDIKRIIGG